MIDFRDFLYLVENDYSYDQEGVVWSACKDWEVE